MAFRDWSEAVAELSKELVAATPRQLEVGQLLGVEIRPRLPRGVAAARLKSALGPELGTQIRDPSEEQIDLLRELAGKIQRRVPTCATSIEADAWIRDYLCRLRIASLEKLMLTTGDVVLSVDGLRSGLFQVSSIGRVGRVHFRGASGAWPDKLDVVARAGDDSHEAQLARQDVANRLARRRIEPSLSAAMSERLAKYSVSEEPSEAEFADLELVIEAAADERPIHAFLKSHRHLLAATLGGAHARFVRPNVRLGADYEADFLLAHSDSRGLRWVLVELETPGSSITLKSGKDFDRQTRTGIGQIKEWREWLQNNLDYATRPKSRSGLGLEGIRPRSKGLVVVGRRDRLGPSHQSLRNRLEEGEQIRVHTYDWLLDRIRAHLAGLGRDPERIT